MMKCNILFSITCLLINCGCSQKHGNDQPVDQNQMAYDTQAQEMPDTITNKFKVAEEFDYDKWLLQNRVPLEIRNVLLKYDSQYRFYFDLNPFYLRGDFNGDQEPDIAILIEEVKTSKRGILIHHGGRDEVYIIGSGTSLLRESPVPNEAATDDMYWLHIWFVYGKGKVEPGEGEDKPLELIGEAIYAERAEAASGLIYWNGKGYYFYQQAD